MGVPTTSGMEDTGGWKERSACHSSRCGKESDHGASRGKGDAPIPDRTTHPGQTRLPASSGAGLSSVRTGTVFVQEEKELKNCKQNGGIADLFPSQAFSCRRLTAAPPPRRVRGSLRGKWRFGAAADIRAPVDPSRHGGFLRTPRRRRGGRHLGGIKSLAIRPACGCSGRGLRATAAGRNNLIRWDRPAKLRCRASTSHRFSGFRRPPFDAAGSWMV